MNKPEIKQILGGHLYRFSEEKLEVKSTHVRIDADGRVKSELEFILLGEQGGYIHRCIVNLLSSTGMKNLEKTLTNKIPDIDWQIILEVLAKTIVDHVRRGEDVKVLDTSQEVRRPEYLLYPLLPKGQPTILYGDRGALKSHFAGLMALTLALPYNDNPYGYKEGKKPVRTLFLD